MIGRGFLTRFRLDRRGVAATELALLAPIMIFFYFALAEFCQGFMAQKRMGHASAMVADLVAQTDVVQRSEIDDIFGIGDILMKPFSSTPLKIRVSSIARNEQGQTRVVWSRGKGMAPLTGAVAVPAGLIENGQSLIMSEATYDYDSPVDYLMPRITRFSHTYYSLPRKVDQVGCEDC